MMTKFMRNEQYSIIFNNMSASKSKWSQMDRQVKQLQIQYQQMSAKIIEKMNCGRMQLDIISTFMDRNQASNSDHQDTQHSQNISKLQSSSGSTFASQLSQSTGSLNKSMKEQLKNQQNWLSYLYTTLKEDNEILSQHLIIKQIDIQSRKQLHLKLKNYQTRIRQLQQILVRKQIDISVLSNENYKLPKLPVIRKFTNQCIELSNIKTMGDKYMQISKQYMRQKNKKLDNKSQILMQITSSMENNALPNKSRFASQNMPEQIVRQRLSKKIIKQDDIGVFNDPLFKKIIKILQKQLQREQKLLKQYNQLQKNLKNLNTELQICKQNQRNRT